MTIAMVNDNQSEGSKLRAARQIRGLTQARMAARLGISPGWYALIEREPTFLSERLARRAAEILGVPAEDLQP